MRKKVLIGMPSNLLSLIDQAAEAECRTRSDLVREALRRYIDEFNRNRLAMRENSLNLQLLENSYAASPDRGCRVEGVTGQSNRM